MPQLSYKSRNFCISIPQNPLNEYHKIRLVIIICFNFWMLFQYYPFMGSPKSNFGAFITPVLLNSQNLQKIEILPNKSQMRNLGFQKYLQYVL